MKPISAWYFIKENRGRCVALAFMFVLTFIAYIGGLYVTNVQTSFDYHIEAMKKFASVNPKATDNDWSEFNKALNEIEKDDRIKLIKQGVISSVGIQSIMGFNNMYNQYAFNSVKDFKTFCEFRDIGCDYSKLESGHVIMSQMAANNRGLEIGDRLVSNEEDSLFHSYTLGAITDEEGYWIYYINDDENLNYILLPVGMSEEEFARYTSDLKNKYNIYVHDRADTMVSIGAQLEGMNLIYAFIVGLVAVIMAVTINAAFVGMYQHRKPEFAIYRAIGISKGRVIRKVAGELLLIDFAGMAVGGVVIMLILFILNELVLFEQGLWLDYFHPLAFVGLIVCNLAVLVPMIITRSRQLLKADICEY